MLRKIAAEHFNMTHNEVASYVEFFHPALSSDGEFQLLAVTAVNRVSIANKKLAFDLWAECPAELFPLFHAMADERARFIVAVRLNKSVVPYHLPEFGVHHGVAGGPCSEVVEASDSFFFHLDYSNFNNFAPIVEIDYDGNHGARIGEASNPGPGPDEEKKSGSDNDAVIFLSTPPVRNIQHFQQDIENLEWKLKQLNRKDKAYHSKKAKINKDISWCRRKIRQNQQPATPKSTIVGVSDSDSSTAIESAGSDAESDVVESPQLPPPPDRSSYSLFDFLLDVASIPPKVTRTVVQKTARTVALTTAIAGHFSAAVMYTATSVLTNDDHSILHLPDAVVSAGAKFVASLVDDEPPPPRLAKQPTPVSEARAVVEIAQQVRPLVVRNEVPLERVNAAATAALVAVKKAKHKVDQGGDDCDFIAKEGTVVIARLAHKGMCLARTQLADLLRRYQPDLDDGVIAHGDFGVGVYQNFLSHALVPRPVFSMQRISAGFWQFLCSANPFTQSHAFTRMIDALTGHHAVIPPIGGDFI